MNKIDIGDGFVALVDSMGDDESISRYAGISHNNDRGPGTGKLVDWGHMVPLEFGQAIFLIKMPLFILRQFQRTRTFSYVEKSGRYNDLTDVDFFMPTRHDSPEVIDEIAIAYTQCKNHYARLLELGVPKELARIVLPQGMFTEFYVRMDMNNARKMLKLRLDSHAQEEMQEYARAIYTILQQHFPMVMEGLV